MDVRLPDGTTLANVPEGTTQAELVNRLSAAGMGHLFATAEDRKMADPTAGMSGFQKFNAGMGKAVSDLGLGARQLFGNASDADAAESRKRDQPLMQSGAAQAGNIAGSAAPFAMTAMIPGANTYTGATLAGALSGALQPTTDGESRVSNTAVGGALGVGSQALANGLMRVGKGAVNTLNPEERRLAQFAQNEGINLSASQQTGSRALKTLDAAFENIPSTSGAQARLANNQASQFNRAALSRAGITGDLATPDVLTSQKRALGTTFEDIASRNAVDFQSGLTQQLQTIQSEASRRLAHPQGVTNTIDDMISDAAAQSGYLAGTKYQGWRSELGRLAKGNDTEAHYFGQAKKALDAAFDSQVSGADAAAWKQASREYANLKTISGAMGGGGMAPNAGNISPAQLSQALSGAVSREGKALGRGDLNDLSRVGNTFLRQQVPDSGTARRMLAQGLLTGGAGYGITQDPKAALAAGVGGMAAPAAVRALMYSKPAQKVMTQGVPKIADNEELIRALIRGGTLAGQGY